MWVRNTTRHRRSEKSMPRHLATFWVLRYLDISERFRYVAKTTTNIQINIIFNITVNEWIKQPMGLACCDRYFFSKSTEARWDLPTLSLNQCTPWVASTAQKRLTALLPAHLGMQSIRWTGQLKRFGCKSTLKFTKSIPLSVSVSVVKLTSTRERWLFHIFWILSGNKTRRKYLGHKLLNFYMTQLNSS